MGLTSNQKDSIESLLKACIRSRFKKYNPEPAVMPFHTRLLGKDRLALYAFIHSLNTSFGISVFEPAAKAIAISRFSFAEIRQRTGTKISTEAQRVIQNIMDNLTSALQVPCKVNEIELIRDVCRQGDIRSVKPTMVDLKLIDNAGRIYLIDLKTAKPNAGDFKGYKRTLLEWVAITLHDDPDSRIHTLLAIPYNPYEPEPYNRWTLRGMIDLDQELKVADEFWDFLGGDGTYLDLLDIFERVGIKLRSEIDAYFERFNRP